MRDNAERTTMINNGFTFIAADQSVVTFPVKKMHKFAWLVNESIADVLLAEFSQPAIKL